MALTNEQYDSLMRQYNHKQMRNHQVVSLRTDELYKAVPSLSVIDEQVASISVSSISAFLNGSLDSSLNSKQKLEELRQKRTNLIISAGFPENYLDPPYDCPDCKDTGYVAGRRCHCFKQAAINLVYSQSNIGTILSKENFDSYDINVYDDDYFEGNSTYSARAIAQNAYDEAKNFVQNFSTNGGNLLLLGHTGCGKTFLSNCIAKELLDNGNSVIYFTAYELFDIFEKKTFNKSKDVDVSEAHEHLFNCDLLIIDDLGTEMSNTFTVSSLFQCLNERLLAGKSTIISTNLDLAALVDKYTERTTSRIFSNYKLIKLVGKDIRMKKLNI